MEITGKIISLLPLQSGQGKGGTWKKQEFILEIPGQYPRKVCMNLWGEKVDEFKLNVGEVITASINIESREYNGRWYTDIRAWKIAKKTDSSIDHDRMSETIHPPTDETITDSSAEDDLPF